MASTLLPYSSSGGKAIVRPAWKSDRASCARWSSRPALISSWICLSHSSANLEEIQLASLKSSSLGSCSIATSISLNGPHGNILLPWGMVAIQSTANRVLAIIRGIRIIRGFTVGCESPSVSICVHLWLPHCRPTSSSADSIPLTAQSLSRKIKVFGKTCQTESPPPFSQNEFRRSASHHWTSRISLAFIQKEKWPLTPNGKLDRGALLASLTVPERAGIALFRIER